ncbi:MAG: hypothetical protein KatS3mg043_1436 [Rhodothermaceae bacterium]|nr:MAG: hypothetical protein KatS3mg043_1436 [Rhodothermaceae bacterium]
MSPVLQQFISRLERLPEELREHYAARFLEELDKADTTEPKYRIAGLGEGSVTMTRDFDEPLPDDFWTGQA